MDSTLSSLQGVSRLGKQASCVLIITLVPFSFPFIIVWLPLLCILLPPISFIFLFLFLLHKLQIILSPKQRSFYEIEILDNPFLKQEDEECRQQDVLEGSEEASLRSSRPRDETGAEVVDMVDVNGLQTTSLTVPRLMKEENPFYDDDDEKHVVSHMHEDLSSSKDGSGGVAFQSSGDRASDICLDEAGTYVLDSELIFVHTTGTSKHYIERSSLASSQGFCNGNAFLGTVVKQENKDLVNLMKEETEQYESNRTSPKGIVHHPGIEDEMSELEVKSDGVVVSSFDPEASAAKFVHNIVHQEKNLQERRILEDIDVIKKIVGYDSEARGSALEQITALYLFLGMEPYSWEVERDDLDRAQAELELLKVVVGVK
ncbi:hypothetical protein KP509_36G027100 [Ceratopteris richardii]|uniref:Uncharacterized protein n=1 Tax=Ceratopteris richardii TaxID=49495 RepID=A0A8T2QBH2_CERRI|nr:hypothetical protein KP509_36G027100 [Ceratopteris richardii]